MNAKMLWRQDLKNMSRFSEMFGIKITCQRFASLLNFNILIFLLSTAYGTHKVVQTKKFNRKKSYFCFYDCKMRILFNAMRAKSECQNIKKIKFSQRNAKSEVVSTLCLSGRLWNFSKIHRVFIENYKSFAIKNCNWGLTEYFNKARKLLGKVISLSQK